MKRKVKHREKSPVRLRMKETLNGNRSLYLDIYHNGSRRREYLKLYLIPEKDASDKEQNRKTLEIAETIRAEKILELNTRKSKVLTPPRKELSMPFVEYMENEIKKTKHLRAPGYAARYRTGKNWVVKYDSSSTLQDIDTRWVKGLMRFLTTSHNRYGRPLDQNTIHEYLVFVSSTLNAAEREGLIGINPFKKIPSSDKPKKRETQRCYLTEQEIRKLESTPYIYKYGVDKAFLFACYTGLRYSDIIQLKWENIKEHEDGMVLEKIIQKTKKMLYLPLSKTASGYLPPRTKDKDLVFNLKETLTSTETHIRKWCKSAGIDKHVTFHTSRHSFAVNILAKGGDIYTLSKLLGHKRVTTTQIYAEVLDEAKKKAVELLDK